MFEKEAKERAKDFTDNKERQAAYECGFLDGVDKATEDLKEKLAGLKVGRLKWHKVADGDLPKGENIHRDIYLKDRYGNLYTGNYFPKDETHTEDCFAVEFLDWGFQGSQFCKKEQISEWCEISKEEIK